MHLRITLNTRIGNYIERIAIGTIRWWDDRDRHNLITHTKGW